MKVREIPQIAIDFIKKWEGCTLHEYKDIAGFKTIGVGHLVLKGEDFSGGITEEQAEELLRKDLLTAAVSITRLINVPLNDNQYSSLLSFVFNLGGGALQRSTLRSRLNRGEYVGAAEEFEKWCWASGRKIRGLLLRRLSEKILFLGEY